MWKYMDFLSGRNPDKTLVFMFLINEFQGGFVVSE